MKMMNNNQLSVSIILLCYNPKNEAFSLTLLSCLSQKNVSFEIIVSDDGSKSLDWWDESYSGFNNDFCERVIFNRNAVNCGTVRNISSALKLARGKYIKCISPGDFFFDDLALSKLYDYAFLNRCDLVYGKQVNYFNVSCTLSKIPLCLSTHNNCHRKNNILFFNDHLHGANLLVETNWFNYCIKSIYSKVYYCEDFPVVWFSLIEEKKISQVKTYTLFYEQSTGISSNACWKDKMCQDMMSFLQILNVLYPNSTVVQKTIRLRHSDKSKTISLILFKLRAFISIVFKSVSFFFKKKYFEKQLKVIKNNLINENQK